MDSSRVCIVGAGFSGLCVASLLKAELGISSLKIYDKDRNVGGTWHANRYPGIACDVPGYFYSFSFFRKFDWSAIFSPGEEFQQYARAMVDHYGLDKNLILEHSVQRCHWQPEKGLWLVTVENLRNHNKIEETFDFVILGTGRTRLPNVPTEFLNFKGRLFHSAAWDSSVEMDDCRVGIVGTGASATQIITAMADKVNELIVFQRTAPHVLPRPQCQISSKFKWAITKVPGLYLVTRYTIFWMYELVYTSMRQGTVMHALLKNVSNWWRQRQLRRNPGLLSKTTPNYALGCKRFILSSEFYPALTAPNVKLITEKITCIQDSSIITEDGEKHDLDVLVMATGFQSSEFFSPLQIIGKEDKDLLSLWKVHRPRLYMGIMAEEAPNMFTILGPYTQVGHSSNSFNMELQAQWIIRALKLAREKKARIINIRKDAIDRYMNHVDEGFKNKVWKNGGCTSWFLDGQQRNIMLWTHSQINFWRWARNMTDDLFHFSNI